MKNGEFVLQQLHLDTPEKREQTIVVLGNASFDHASKGHSPTLNTMNLYWLLRNLGVNVHFGDEYRTSKLCSNCTSIVKPFTHRCTVKEQQAALVKHQQLPEAVQLIHPFKPRSTRQPWGLRRCPNPGCRVLWNRDINAAINICDLFLYQHGAKFESYHQTQRSSSDTGHHHVYITKPSDHDWFATSFTREKKIKFALLSFR